MKAFSNRGGRGLHARRIWERLPVWLFVFATFFSAMSPNIQAHPDVETRIQIINGQISANPHDASLLVARGELHAEHEDWAAALYDFNLAAELDPSLTSVDFHRGRLLHGLDESTGAKQALIKFVRSSDPGQTDKTKLTLAHLLLGEIMESRQQWRLAASHYDSAIRSSPGINPGFYIARARALVAADSTNHELAIRGLDDRLAASPGTHSLLEYAVDLELDRNNFEGALLRIRRMIDTYPGLPRWRLRLAKVQLASGRTADARRTYIEALNFIDGLPGHSKSKIYRSGLAADIEHGLEQLE